MATRIYAVRHAEENEIIALVEAQSEVAVLKHVARTSYDINVATPRECADAGAAGVKIEVAGEVEPTIPVSVANDPLPLVAGGVTHHEPPTEPSAIAALTAAAVIASTAPAIAAVFVEGEVAGREYKWDVTGVASKPVIDGTLVEPETYGDSIIVHADPTEVPQ